MTGLVRFVVFRKRWYTVCAQMVRESEAMMVTTTGPTRLSTGSII